MTIRIVDFHSSSFLNMERKEWQTNKNGLLFCFYTYSNVMIFVKKQNQIFHMFFCY